MALAELIARFKFSVAENTFNAPCLRLETLDDVEEDVEEVDEGVLMALTSMTSALITEISLQRRTPSCNFK